MIPNILDLAGCSREEEKSRSENILYIVADETDRDAAIFAMEKIQ